MNDHTLPLDHPSVLDPAVSGGKGASLARLVGAGLPVPDGFVVTAQAFARSLAELLPPIEEALGRADEADLQALNQACAEVAQRIVTHPLPAELETAVTRAYDRLGAAAVAVRSSATAEDLPGASFAGQYDTFLNVPGPASVLERILHVWASLYSAHAVAYRRRQGIAESGMRMAVIVQRQLPAEAAGVLFTRDPVSGSNHQFVVNATFGLGEGVVAGHLATDRFALHPQTGAVLERDLAPKTHMVDARPGGEVVTVELQPEMHERPALDDGQLRELATLAREVKALFGGDQDIEFAVYDGAVHLLQARPVTAVEQDQEFPVEWETPDDAARFWVLSNIAQRQPKPAKRLEVDSWRAYAAGMRRCFEETGSPIARMHIYRFINGYLYVRAPEVDEDQVAERLAKLHDAVQWYARRRRSWWEEALEPQVRRVLDPLTAFRPDRADLSALIAQLERAVEGHAHVLGDLHWRLAARIGEPMAWVTTLAEAGGLDERDVPVLVQATEVETTRMVRRMRDLARLVKGDRVLRSIFANGVYERLREPKVAARAAAMRFRSRFASFLRRYGRRTGRGFGSATDFSTPTWNIDPRPPLDVIAAYAEQNLDRIDRLERDARRERDRAVRRVRRSLAGSRRRLREFDIALTAGRDHIRTMENHNHLMEQSTAGALRDAIYWAGRGLVRAGLVDDPDDALHLSLDELRSIVAGAGPADVRALIGERQREFEHRSRLRAPPTLGSGTPSAPPMPKWMELPPDAGLDGQVVRGVSGSRGRATGRARVVPPSAKPPHVEKGDILVAPNAGPNWTPIFPLLGGLVLDQGAVFQHAALVAREYRIPAVIMTKEATSAIQDGQQITVDGDAGLVELAP